MDLIHLGDDLSLPREGDDCSSSPRNQERRCRATRSTENRCAEGYVLDIPIFSDEKIGNDSVNTWHINIRTVPRFS
jgi:hypothetical protein